MKKTIIKLNIIKLSVLISAGIFSSFCFPVLAQAKEINQENVVSLVNQSRTENDLKPLFINPELAQIAKLKAQDMIENHYFSHTSPEGLTPWYWFSQNDYSYQYAGENLAINYEDAEEEHSAWMNSPTHKKNILNPNFTEIGIATATGIIENKKSHITVQIFATPQSKILGTTKNITPHSKGTYILGAQTTNPPLSSSNKKTPTYEIIGASNKLILIAKSQSNKIIWTIAIFVLTIISRDMVINNIYPQKIHHKYSMANLLIFLILFSIFF